MKVNERERTATVRELTRIIHEPRNGFDSLFDPSRLCRIPPFRGNQKSHSAVSPLKGGMPKGQEGLIAMDVQIIMNLPGIELFIMNNSG